MKKSLYFQQRSFSLDLKTYPIAIIGAGIGGAALSYILNRENIPYLLFDRDENINSRPQGYALTIQQGISVLRSIGILTSVVQNKYNKKITRRMKTISYNKLEDRNSNNYYNEKNIDDNINNNEIVTIPNCTISRSHISLSSSGELLGVYGPPLESSSLLLNDLDTYGTDLPVEFPQYNFDESINTKNIRQNIHMPRQSLRNTLLCNSNLSSIRWNHKLSDICYESIDNKHIILKFQNNSENYKVSGVIGCDGIYSITRKVLFNKYFSQSLNENENQVFKSFHERNMIDHKLNFLNLFVILGISPCDLHYYSSQVRRKVQWLDGNTRIFSMPYDEKHDMWQLSFPISSEEIFELEKNIFQNSNSTQQLQFSSKFLKELALKQCSNWHSTLVSMLERTDASLISGYPVYDRDPINLSQIRHNLSSSTPLYSNIPVTLLGDSWHPMSPFKAQGANQALIDAYSLSNQIISWYEKKSELNNNNNNNNNLSVNDNTLGSYFEKYELEGFERSCQKVLKSRSTAIYLHSKAAMNPGNITRASVAEKYSEKNESII